MSNTAVMPLNDYVAACDTIREKIPEIVLVDKTIYREEIGGFTETLVTGTLIEGEQYSIKYTDTGLGNFDEGGIYSASLVNVPNVGSVVGMAVLLKHPVDDGATYYIYVYQSGDNIMLYVTDAYNATNGSVSISVSAITGKIVSGEMPEKINEVYEAGQKAEHDKFWDVYQENGERKNYQNAFWGEGWNDETFKPKYDISLNATSKEYHNTQTFEYSKITDINKILNDCGVRIISSGVERLNGTFRYATITNLDLDVSSCVSMLMVFYGMNYLKSLSLRNLRADCAFDRVITFCSALENLSITGTIGTGTGGNSSINLQYSPLTKESLLNVIGCLKDFRETTTTETHSIILGTTNLKKLTNEEKAIATQKGWTLT